MFTESRKYIGEEYDSGTGLSYLNARYYDGGRGQFLSQDGVFWEIGQSEEGRAVLKNPQMQNSYSYAGNNPVVNRDPTGRYAHILIGAGGGIVGQYGYDVYKNIQNNGFSGEAFTSNLSSGKTYVTRATQGAAIALTGGAVTVAGTSIGIGAIGQGVIMGGVSSVIGAGGSAFLGESVTPESVGLDAVIGGATFSLGSMIPKVPGRLPNFGTKAFFTGKHTQQSAQNIILEGGANYMSSFLNEFIRRLKDFQMGTEKGQRKSKSGNTNNKKENR